MAPSDQRIGAFLGLGAATFMGFSHSVVVLAYSSGADPLTVSATRFMLPVLALIAYLAIKGEPMFMPRRHGFWALGLGVLTALYNLCLLIALDLLPAGIAMLVFYLFPLLTGALIAIIGWARFDRRMVAAAVVALLGIALTLGVGLGDYSLFGLAMSLVAAIGISVMSVISIRVIAASDPLRTTAYMCAGATASLLIIASALDGFQWPTGGQGWTGFLLSHLFYAVGLIAYFVALGRVGAPITTMLSNLQPLVVIAVAFFLLDQTLAPLQLLGAALVIGALVVAVRREPAASEI